MAPPRIANGRYTVVRRLGAGAFGEVYLVSAEVAVTGSPLSPTQSGAPSSEEPQKPAAPPETRVEYFAAKLEPIKSSHQPHLQHEARLYAYLGRSAMSVGIPRLKWYGTEGDFNVMVMELVGPSLGDLFDYCRKQLSLKTLLMLGEQMVARLEFVHAMGYLHRDLKPENFTMGVGERAHHVYLLDFGLAKRYQDPTSRAHISYSEGKALTGTARYVSINTHVGVQQSRRDDLESLGHVLVYLAKGTLPWQGVKYQTKGEKNERIKQMKIDTPVSVLCEGLPSCFGALVTYARSLKYDEAPNYKQCRESFGLELEAQGLVRDYQYSWLQPRPEADTVVQSCSSSFTDSSRVGLSQFSEAGAEAPILRPAQRSDILRAKRPPAVPGAICDDLDDFN